MKNPIVTVLMSCYNAEHYLCGAIESVLEQSFQDFEFLIIDDGSADETHHIIQSYSDQDDRIVAIHKNNTGLADSLNVGISQARGAWIARLDADDLCEPARLAEQVRFVHENPDVILVGTNHFEVDEQGLLIKEQRYPSDHERLVSNLERSRRFFSHSSAFFNAEMARQVDGYNPRILRAEDKRLWLEFSLRGKLACLPESLVRIRKHAQQISLLQQGNRQLYDGIAATVCHLLKKDGHKDPSVSASEDEWVFFLDWIESKVLTSGALERQRVWAEARAIYFTPASRTKRLTSFFAHLLRSGFSGSLLLERLFGSSLPERLAQEWIDSSSSH